MHRIKCSTTCAQTGMLIIWPVSSSTFRQPTVMHAKGSSFGIHRWGSVHAAYHFSIDKLPVWVGIQRLYNCVQNVLYSCQLHAFVELDPIRAKPGSVTRAVYTNLNFVVRAVVVLVHCLQPPTVVVRMWDQVNVQLTLDPAKATLSITDIDRELRY